MSKGGNTVPSLAAHGSVYNAQVVLFKERCRAHCSLLAVLLTMNDRYSFDALNLSALDDIARLLHIHRAVRDMNDTFKNGGAQAG
ncbi:MAG: hypothetical protein JWP60_131 [Ramlibacter sp.]|nr:hypothetical protein [Ramlibacter sp.]